MTIRYATAEDVPALDLLISKYGCGEKPGLQITRNPDLALLFQDSPDNIFLVAESGNGEIVASYTAEKKSYIIGGVRYPVHIISNPVIHPEHMNNLLPVLLFKKMHQELTKRDSNFLLYDTDNGMMGSMPLFSEKEGILPFFKMPATLEYLILPRSTSREMAVPFTVANYDQLPVKFFYESFYGNQLIHDAVEQLHSYTHFTSSRQGEIKAALTLRDSASMSQKVRIYNQIGSGWRALIRHHINSLFYLSPIPCKGESYRIMNTKYFGYAPGHESTLILLLKYALEFAWESGCEFLSILVDERNETLRTLLKPYERMVFRSERIISSMQGNVSLLREIASATLEQEALA